MRNFSICFICFIFLFFFSLMNFFFMVYFIMNNMILFLEWELISLNSMGIVMCILLDWMSLLFMMFVFLISSVVIYYSKSYMSSELNLNRFIILVLLFVFSMVLLIISPNIISIFLGWDGLGLVSYCLVIYYQNIKSYNAGMLTALSNRIGDVCILMVVAWMMNYGSWNYIFYLNFMKNDFFMVVITLMIILAAMTKSAQIPFSSWLPAAMAAPTPVSALVHSSTLVTAGVYLLMWACTETGLYKGIYDGELVPSSYQLVRCDRDDGRKHGGVLLAAAPPYSLSQVSLPGDFNVDKAVFELVCCVVNKYDKPLFLCCVVYIPPGAKNTDYMKMFQLLEECQKKYKKVILVGDFNLYSATLETNCYFEYFLTFCEFRQLNNVVNCNDSTLDLVLTNMSEEEMMVNMEQDSIVPVDQQHPPLCIRYSGVVRSRRSEVELEKDDYPSPPPCVAENAFPMLFEQANWNFSKADFSTLYRLLETADWHRVSETTGVKEALGILYNMVFDIIDKCVPKKKLVTETHRFVYPDWYTAEMIRDMETKAQLHKNYKMGGSQEDYELFSYYRSKVKNQMETEYERHQNRIQTQFKKEPKTFWAFVNSKRSNQSEPKVAKGDSVLSGAECAHEFAKYFLSVYKTESPSLNAEEAAATTADNGARVHVGKLSMKDVKAALNRLKPKQSAGPDGIPAFVVKDCRSVLAEPLLHIFNLCLEKCEYPDVWKLTKVSPVPKGGKGSDVSDFRPVAMLSTFAKVFETMLYLCIYPQVSAYLIEAQHGFRRGRNTDSNLMSLTSYVVPVMDAKPGGQVDVAYFDFRKAFDVVDNDVLLMKLAAVGFTPSLLSFFSCYLRDSKQYVNFGGHVSEPYPTLSGVSQGSNLGPLEFLLLINDLPDVVKNAKCLLFADDLKLYLDVKDLSDCSKLQDDIDSVVNWADVNCLEFNMSKCCTMSFSRALDPFSFKYTMKEEPMKTVQSVRDLGVQFNNRLDFSDHMVSMCKTAFRNLGFMLSQDFKNTEVVKSLYNALVRSKLEFGGMMWSPHETKYSLMVEKIQNKFLSYLYLKSYGVYPFYPLMYPTLFVLGMVGYNSLELSREVATVFYVWSVLRGKLYNEPVLEALRLVIPQTRLSQAPSDNVLEVPSARTNLLKYAPLSSAMASLNKMAGSIDIWHCSLAEFSKHCVLSL